MFCQTLFSFARPVLWETFICWNPFSLLSFAWLIFKLMFTGAFVFLASFVFLSKISYKIHIFQNRRFSKTTWRKKRWWVYTTITLDFFKWYSCRSFFRKVRETPVDVLVRWNMYPLRVVSVDWPVRFGDGVTNAEVGFTNPAWERLRVDVGSRWRCNLSGLTDPCILEIELHTPKQNSNPAQKVGATPVEVLVKVCSLSFWS